ncbi:uncharacterized protein LOC110810583 isoform X7 [Carica papaya]|uniref:uncharacterized protein LOC110810583 isoform X7 n=1 Tax=Carica papaya TaxID=3649 RepID=UPI000B8C7B8C|nr:uncharacterized protein LOC110810583 isoform X7 [Carica papaya]
MLVRALPSTSRVFTLILSSSSRLTICFRKRYRSTSMTRETGLRDFNSGTKKSVNFRLCNVSSHTTELLEIQADDPTFHVLFIPGNPGVITFYKEFVESLYELLGGNASVTAIGHISHTKKDWERGKLFSLEEQIDHKVPDSFCYNLSACSTAGIIACVGFKVNRLKICWNIMVCDCCRCYLYSLATGEFVLDEGGSFFVCYHTMRNVLFMAMTEFKELSKTPNWTFMRENQHKISFLYGIDDHWGPMYMFNEISKQAPKISLSVEGEGHTHAFCCTEAGSLWVAHHVTSLIEKKISGQT